MKKLLLLLFAAMPMLMQAQGFEGEIKFQLDYAGDKADMIKAMAPSANTVKIKGDNVKVVTEGGMAAGMIGDIIMKGAEKMTYFVNSATKTVYKASQGEMDGMKKKDDNITVKKEKGTATILGYKCNEYTITDSKGSKSSVWATTEIDLGGTKWNGKVEYKGVEGIILKRIMNVSDQGMSFTITMTCVQFERKTISDSEFDIPSDYTVKEGVPDLVRMQMEGK